MIKPIEDFTASDSEMADLHKQVNRIERAVNMLIEEWTAFTDMFLATGSGWHADEARRILKQDRDPNEAYPPGAK